MGAYSEVYLGAYSEVYLGAYSEVYLGAYSEVYLGAYSEVYLRAYSEVYLRAYSEVYLGAYSEVYLGVSRALTWEHIVKQAGSVPSSPIGSVLVSKPGSILENELVGVFGSVSQAGWKCTIECNQE